MAAKKVPEKAKKIVVHRPVVKVLRCTIGARDYDSVLVTHRLGSKAKHGLLNGKLADDIDETHPGLMDKLSIGPEYFGAIEETDDIQVSGDDGNVVSLEEAKGKRAKRKKQTRKERYVPRHPGREYEDAMHLTRDGRPGVPAHAIKQSMVETAVEFDEVTKIGLRKHLFVKGDILPIEGSVAYLHEGFVRLGGMTKAPDVRWRPLFSPDWFLELEVEYTAGRFDETAVLNLLEWAGHCVGLGENRPEKSGGRWGKYKVLSSAEATKRKKAWAVQKRKLKKNPSIQVWNEVTGVGT